MALLVVLFLAVAAGAYPVVRGLTRRLESLKQGVEAFGSGALHQRVAEEGRDEVAALGASFNQAAGRIEALLRSHQSLLANASQRCCGHTRACWPTPAMNCARPWRG